MDLEQSDETEEALQLGEGRRRRYSRLSARDGVL